MKELEKRLKDAADCTIVKNSLPFEFYYQNDAFNIQLFNRDYLKFIYEYNDIELSSLFVGVCKNQENDIDLLLSLVFSGMMIIYDKKRRKYYSLDLIHRPVRGVSDSISEPDSITGARDGFVENIKANITLLRNRVKDSNLEINEYVLGRRSKTKVQVLSIKDLTNEGYLHEVLYYLDKIDVDAILSIEDISSVFQGNAIMPQYLYLGSPDLASRRLYNGEILILIDGIPNVICLPNTVESFIKLRLEHINLKVYSHFERIFVMISFFLSTVFLSLLGSFVTFQSDSLSLLILSTLKITQKGVILPIYLEIAFVLFLFELYYIVSFKSPKITLSSMVVMVGGLIIGQNTVDAGIVGVVIITITALCFLASFTISSNVTFVMSLSLLRTMLLLSSLVFGIFGVALLSIYLITRISSESKFSISYLFPFIPPDRKGFKKFFLFEGSPKLKTRPQELKTTNRRKKK